MRAIPVIDGIKLPHPLIALQRDGLFFAQKQTPLVDHPPDRSRMKRYYLLSLVLVCVLAMVLWRQFRNGQEFSQSSFQAIASTSVGEPIQPIAIDSNLDERKVRLGEALFNDPQLSKDNSISCASCHGLTTGGVDRLSHSIGINGAVGSINAPTVFNSGANFKQFWDGRAETLEDQIDGPVQAAGEMGSSWPEVISKLSKSPDYVSSFEALYADGIQVRNIKDAIATFERSLSTPDSRFDQYLRGDSSALSDEEKQGYHIFKSYGCITCHQGINVGGNMFQTFGVMADYFADRGNITRADLGRFNVTEQEKDRYVFKVPSLRNVALTAPYFHDGTASDLQDAVRVMAKYQLGRQLSNEEVASLVSFLKTLSGKRAGE